MKFKIISDYSYLTDTKKIVLIKAGTVIENFTYISGNSAYTIDKSIIEANPEYFQFINWKTELPIYLKQCKIPQGATLTKQLIPFIEKTVLSDNTTAIDNKDLDVIMKAANTGVFFGENKDAKVLFAKYGYVVDAEGNINRKK